MSATERPVEPRPGRWRGLEPRDHLERGEIDRGLRLLTLDGISSQVMGALTGGALLVGFALLLGASNKVIGLIAAIGPLTQLLQIPAILLVELSGRRKALVLASSSVGRAFWLVVAAIPWLVPPGARVATLFAGLFLYYGCGSVASAAYNSWKRDLVPDAVMGRYFARRLTLATAAGALVTLGAGFAVDHGAALLGDPARVYGALFFVGGLVGLAGVGFLAAIPEPRMAVAREQSLLAILAEPLREGNFRKLLVFLASWNFAINLAAPFFSVYMLVRLELPMAWVLSLSVLSQIANVSFFRIWGRLADRISNKSVLSLSGSLFIISIALWPFTTLPERYILTIPLLLAIHVLAGVSTAGVNLCAGSITLKLAPRGKATSFLATNALTSGIAATLAPLVAGVLADALADDRLSVGLTWTAAANPRMALTAIDLRGLDFLFVLAVLVGLYSLHRLLAVREEGEAQDATAAVELYGEVRRVVRHVSNVAGLRRLTYFPYALLRYRQRDDDRDDQPPPTPDR